MGRKWNNIKYGKAAKDAASSKESVDTKIAGLDETFANKTNSSMQSINKAFDAKAEEIKTEIDAAKATMISESQKAINETTDTGKQEINTVGAEQITNIQKAAQAVTDASKKLLDQVNHITFSLNAEDGGLDIIYTE